MSGLPDLFPGFAERRIATQGAEIFLRTGGTGPPLLLLHGYPQLHVCWHNLAPEPASRCTLAIPDLRGYGRSAAPPSDAAHEAYSKRAMAADCCGVMRALGHSRFIVAGHDRGGRVANRLALDHPKAVCALIPLDIIPTADAWRRADAASAIKSYHWAFLAQPFPLPETMIGNDPVMYVEHTLKSWSKSRDLKPFSAGALAHYRGLLATRERVYAVCEDYRAGARIDRWLDEADIAAGRKITCPTFALWGSAYLTHDPLSHLAGMVQPSIGRQGRPRPLPRRGESGRHPCRTGRFPRIAEAPPMSFRAGNGGEAPPRAGGCNGPRGALGIPAPSPRHIRRGRLQPP